MVSTRCFGRVGALAVAMGIGAMLASAPWLAAADPVDPLGLDIDVSFNGTDLFHLGDATATSGPWSLAIAFGAGSTADAGLYTGPGGHVFNGIGDLAFADGAGSTAVATTNGFDSAIASAGGAAFSGLYVSGHVIVASSGNSGFDLASANGAGSTADADGGYFDTATAGEGGTAHAGTFVALSGQPFLGGNGESATALGANSFAGAGGGDDNLAAVFGTDSTALAGIGKYDLAAVFGTDSTALADIGKYDLAAVFGNDLTATAVNGHNLFVIEPDLFAAAATPPDDFGLSALLADFSWLGL